MIDGLKRLGWIEGRTIHFERRAAEGQIDRLPSLVSDLVGLGVEAILTSGFLAIAACKGAPVPAIASGAGDLVSLGLIESLRRPGAYTTERRLGMPGAPRQKILAEATSQSLRCARTWCAAF